MQWEDYTIHTLKKLRENKSYSAWSKAVESGEINDFSAELDELISRLSGVLMSELELDEASKRKIVKIMEMVAVAGRTL